MMNASPIIPWIGGKRRLAGQILPMFPDHTCYVEPFAGAAALFFLKPATKADVLNDVQGELVNLYRVVKFHLEEFVRQFRWTLISRQNWDWLQATAVATLTDVQRAARFYYLQRMAFGGKVVGRSFGTSTTAGPKLNLLRIEEELSAAHLRLASATIEQLDWHDCIERYDRPHTLFYMDPPYWQTEGYGMPFELSEYARLADAMRTMKGKAVLSVNDHPDMREAFKGLRFKRVSLVYSVGRKGRKPAGELIIRNW
jgi:DNA adenine methylase